MKNRLLLSLGLMLLLLPGVTNAASRQLRATGKVETAPVGKNSPKAYLVIGTDPVHIPLEGPGEITGYARVTLPADSAGPVSGALLVEGLPGAAPRMEFTFRPSRRSAFGDGRAGQPSGGRKFTLEVPEGKHTLHLRGEAPGGAPVLAILYYEGPEQPQVPGLVIPEAAQPKPRKKSQPFFSYRGSFSLDVIYNDNVLSNSPEDLVLFDTGVDPDKFINQTTDDLVLAPQLDLQARTKRILSWGTTILRAKVKRWMYTTNPVKTNTDFDFYLRQFYGYGKSLEFYLHYAPEQYIRQLNDRSPLDDPDSEVVSTQFRFQRNIWNLTWRNRLNKKFSTKLIYEQNRRYYNQPFMENDIEAWEIRGNLTWKASKVFTWNFDYSYEDATARAMDMVGETPATSDDSDGSYERDLYRIGLDIRHRSFQKFVDRISLSFLFMDYYYNTERHLVDDPYHRGRRDTFYKGTVDVRRKLTDDLDLKIATRRTERVTYSPWEGDLTTDKDFTQWLYWISLDYRF